MKILSKWLSAALISLFCPPGAAASTLNASLLLWLHAVAKSQRRGSFTCLTGVPRPQ